MTIFQASSDPNKKKNWILKVTINKISRAEFAAHTTPTTIVIIYNYDQTKEIQPLN